MYLDLLLLFLVLVFGILGALQGFIKQILSILSFIAIFLFAQPLAAWLKYSSGWNWFESAPELFTFGISALFILFLFMLAGFAISRLRKTMPDSTADRWLGFALGSAKGILVVLAVALLFQVLPEKTRSKFKELNADANQSLFLRASAPVLEWKALPSVERLREIRSQLEPGLLAKPSKSGPWAFDPQEGIEHD